jgi:Protein of unknown function (DUF2851)
MQEDFLHFLWRTRRFDTNDLRTTDGQPVVIQRPGMYNTHAGPDFFDARIMVGDMMWAGNVEMHVRASEWLQHHHDADPAYANVILHVVWEPDEVILGANDQPIPCVVLADRTPPELLAAYRDLQEQTTWVPCASRWREVPDIVRLNWYDRLLVERLEQRAERLKTYLEATNGDWEETFFRLMARSFGLQINAEPMEALARSISVKTLTKHKHDPQAIEAMVLGQAGWLASDWKDDYPQQLAKEYRFLKHKYQLEPYVQQSDWKFLRLRPANFPTVRLAQLAALMGQSAHLFSQVLEATSVRTLKYLFAAEVSDYWKNHYQFDKPSVARSKRLGKDFVEVLLINTVIPTVFYYGQVRQLPDVREKALRWFDELSAESNSILDGWAEVGATARTAAQSQALLQLKSKYCDARRCMSCAIGTSLLR